jgi:RNase P subunit RPR2
MNKEHIHKFIEGKEKYEGREDGDRRYYLVIFCEECGEIRRELICELISSW